MPSVKSLILRTRRVQENDILVDALGVDGCHRTMLAKNAAKSRKRFSGGVLQSLHYAHLYFSQKTARAFLQEASLIYDFPKIRSHYKKIELAFHFLRLLLIVSREGMDAQKNYFDLLGNSLRTLETSTDLVLLKNHFEFKLLRYTGFFPEDEMWEVLAQTPIFQHNQLELSHRKLMELSSLNQIQIKELQES